MFRRILFLSTGLIALAAAAAWYFHIRLRGEDPYAYAKLVQESADLRSRSALEQSPIRQLRKGVRKDVWTNKDGVRRHASIESADSDLILTQKKDKVEAVENLQGIEAWSKEGIGPFQRLTADLGTLHFPYPSFTAYGLCAEGIPKEHPKDDASSVTPLQDDASLGNFSGQLKSSKTEYAHGAMDLSGPFEIEHPLGRLTGQKGLLNHPPFSGNAPKQGSRLNLEDGVFFEMHQKPFSISSKRLTAELPPFTPFASLQTLRFFDEVEIRMVSDIRAFGHSALVNKESLLLLPASPDSCCTLLRGPDKIDAKEMRFLMEAKELFCLLPRGRLADQGILFSSEMGHVIFEENFQPATVLLEGTVHLISQVDGKESFALADSAIFHVQEKKLVLASAPSQRVLFWQEGLELSAPTVRIIQDAVQGIGDVRLSFDPEEKKLINRFRKYPL